MAHAKAPQRDTAGRVLWRNIPKVIEWCRKNLPGYTDEEAVVALSERLGDPVTIASVRSIRHGYRLHQTPETRARSLKNRPTNPKVPKEPPPPVDPVVAMERTIAARAQAERSRNTTFFELVGQRIITAIKTMPPLPPVKPLKRPETPLHEEEAVLLLSDQQYGLVVDSRESGGIGRYDKEVAREEQEYLLKSMVSIARYHPNVKKLHAWYLGDTMEGETIYGGQLREIDMNVIQQVLYAVEGEARFLRHMTELYEEVDAAGVVGNHGRIGKKGEHSPMSNFDYLTYKILQERCASIKQIKWTVPETWWTIRRVAGWRFLLVHGDKTGTSNLGIPLYGALRFRSRQREMHRNAAMLRAALEDMGIENVTEEDFDFVVMGHHSVAANLMGILMNGSWPGGTEFSIRELSMADIPSQKFFGVHKNYGVTWVRDIQLKPIRPPHLR